MWRYFDLHTAQDLTPEVYLCHLAILLKPNLTVSGIVYLFVAISCKK